MLVRQKRYQREVTDLLRYIKTTGQRETHSICWRVVWGPKSSLTLLKVGFRRYTQERRGIVSFVTFEFAAIDHHVPYV